jgi:hypothetical protein
MEKVIKKYRLTSNQQALDDKKYWQNQTLEHKIEILESLREDAIKLGLYPDQNESKQRLRRVLRITEQK